MGKTIYFMYLFILVSMIVTSIVREGWQTGVAFFAICAIFLVIVLAWEFVEFQIKKFVRKRKQK